MAEWFEDWFNTEEYLNVYRHRNDEDAKSLFDLIKKNITLEKNAKVLDLACGAGRHSILFAKSGFDVTAVDISENLLDVGRKNSIELGLNINFIKSDLRNLKLAQKFQLILSLFTSFGYFENDDENEEVIKIAANHLLNNGYFIIDFFNSVYLKNYLIPVSYDKIEGGIIKQERIFKENRLIKKISINMRDKKKLFHESVRAYTKDELLLLFSNHALKIQNIFGDYYGNDFQESISPRIIIIASK